MADVVLQKVAEYIVQHYGGSQDLEVQDALDFCGDFARYRTREET